ncbi:MAG: hypothetical protein OEO79_13170 [Gemmatimonadota bacterium]|nr:hypothetical protein [Gemmatimonadota bacterium]
MIPQPLHPAVVHFPIVLVVLFPIAAIVALIVIRRGTDARSAWLPVVALAFALAGSAWVAVQTGEGEEEIVEEVVAESAIHEHEEAAELFLPLTFAALMLAAAGLVSGRVGQIGRPVATLGALLLVVAGYRVGHSGGELVYEHGAAQAYAATSDFGVPEHRRDEGRESKREERH